MIKKKSLLNERFSVFAATGYNAVLGIELYRMKFWKVKIIYLY